MTRNEEGRRGKAIGREQVNDMPRLTARGESKQDQNVSKQQKEGDMSYGRRN